MEKKAFFRFEASASIGAGHAIRSCVIAQTLKTNGWTCYLVTSHHSYDFIPSLTLFERVDPNLFYEQPVPHDLLVIDHYDLDINYETYFRSFAKKIMIIDDLANRKHDCDILLDQTYDRCVEDYKHLVPKNCHILTGSDYILLRKEFVEMRFKALEKRFETDEIRRILISMGGGNSRDYILQALDMIKKAHFKGDIDIVLGFQENDKEVMLTYLKDMPNRYQFHVNPNMAQLMYQADLVIGAAGSGIWERCCLGLPQITFQTVENQSKNADLFGHYPLQDLLYDSCRRNQQKSFFYEVDGLGVQRILSYITNHVDSCQKLITLQKIKMKDMDWVYDCQQSPNLRQYSFNKEVPTYDEHQRWFEKKMQDAFCIFEKIMCGEEPCGTLRLDYEPLHDWYVLSWYVLPPFQNRGIGTIVLNLAKHLVTKKIVAFVFKGNTHSHKALIKAGFLLQVENKHGVLYEH